MKAAVLREVNKPLSIEPVPIPQPKSHEVPVRTAACGVCPSDLHYTQGQYAPPLPTLSRSQLRGESQ